MFTSAMSRALGYIEQLLYVVALAYVLSKAVPFYWRWAKSGRRRGLYLGLAMATLFGLIGYIGPAGLLSYPTLEWQFVTVRGLTILVSILYLLTHVFSLPGRARTFFDAISAPLALLLLARFVWAWIAGGPDLKPQSDWRLPLFLVALLLASYSVLIIRVNWSKILPILGQLRTRLQVPPAHPKRFRFLVSLLGVLIALLSVVLIVRIFGRWDIDPWVAQGWRAMYIGLLLFSLFKALPLYVRWMNRQPIFGAVLTLLLCLIFGIVLSDYGLGDLFWRQDESGTQFIVGLSLSSLFALMFLLSFFNEDKGQVGAGRRVAPMAGSDLVAGAGAGFGRGSRVSQRDGLALDPLASGTIHPGHDRGRARCGSLRRLAARRRPGCRVWHRQCRDLGRAFDRPWWP